MQKRGGDKFCAVCGIKFDGFIEHTKPIPTSGISYYLEPYWHHYRNIEKFEGNRRVYLEKGTLVCKDCVKHTLHFIKMDFIQINMPT